MVKIRLRRMGAKKAPYYRIVVADSRFARDGRCIEEIGTYDPLSTDKKIVVDAERANYCSPTVHSRRIPFVCCSRKPSQRNKERPQR